MRDPHKPTRRYLPPRTPETGCSRGQQRETLARSRRSAPATPAELGTVGDQAAGEQTVRHEDAGVENLARDEDLADLRSVG